MSASTQEEVNTYTKGDRVKLNDKTHFLYGNRGTVRSVFGISVEIKLDDKLTIITSYKNLKKIKVVKKNATKSKGNRAASKKRTNGRSVSKSSGSKKSRAS